MHFLSSRSIDKFDDFRQLALMTFLRPTDPTEKQQTVLNAALLVFSRYGFKRSTMEDIASTAGISRAALYLHYRNKEDIFRTLASVFFDSVLADLETVLAAPYAQAEDGLIAAFDAKDGRLMEMIFAAPHGGDLLDTGHSVAADIVSQGEAKIAARLAEWLSQRAIPADLGDAASLAETMLAALKGLKASSRDFVTYREGQKRLARVFGRALG